MRRLWAWLVRHSKAVGLVLSILSLLFGAGVIPRIVETYGRDPAAKRRDTADRFVQRYDGGDMEAIQKAETAFWNGTKGQEIVDIYRKDESFDAREAQRQAVAELISGDGEHRDRVFKLMRFFKDLSTCVAEDRCEVSRTCEKLGKQAQYFESMYRRAITRIEGQWGEDFASHLDHLVSRCPRR